MRNLNGRFLGTSLALGLAICLWAVQQPLTIHAADDQVAPQPVEDDMHEFMEYAFQPGYKRLRTAMAAAPQDNSGWKAIKAESLTLAEGGNLLLLRVPEENAETWRMLSAAVRDQGGQLYAAAKKKDFTTAKQHYNAMLQQCNKCHNEFAGGEYQLKP